MSQRRNPLDGHQRKLQQARMVVAGVCLLIASVAASVTALAIDTTKTQKPAIQITTPKPPVQPVVRQDAPKITGTATVVQQKPQTNLNTNQPTVRPQKNFWCEDDCAPSRSQTNIQTQTKAQNGQSR
jgi:hypothetical protein